MRDTKQVIVMRRDLKMRRGKEVAQGAHASMAVITSNILSGRWTTFRGRFCTNPFPTGITGHNLDNDPIYQWFTNSFTKIGLRCESEKELLDLYNKASAVSIPVALITDNGDTEFNGVPTKTCIAIGPWWSDKIDNITGDLSLF